MCQTLDRALQEVMQCVETAAALGCSMQYGRDMRGLHALMITGYVPLRISAGEFHKMVKVEMSLDPSRYFCWILNHIDMFQTFEIQFLTHNF